MKMNSFSKRSLLNLEGVHDDLKAVCEKAIELSGDYGVDFIITDGHRTMEEQIAFVSQGKSRTLKSRHLGGMAVDFVALVAGRVTYDVSAMTQVAECFKRAAAKLRIPIVWGGDWKSFKDTPHIELSKERYPDAE